MISFKNRLIQYRTNIRYFKLHDFVSPYSYCGIARLGSLESDSVWRIYRIQVSLNGTVEQKVAYNVKWANRLTINYN